MAIYQKGKVIINRGDYVHITHENTLAKITNEIEVYGEAFKSGVKVLHIADSDQVRDVYDCYFGYYLDDTTTLFNTDPTKEDFHYIDTHLDVIDVESLPLTSSDIKDKDVVICTSDEVREDDVMTIIELCKSNNITLIVVSYQSADYAKESKDKIGFSKLYSYRRRVVK